MGAREAVPGKKKGINMSIKVSVVLGLTLVGCGAGWLMADEGAASGSRGGRNAEEAEFVRIRDAYVARFEPLVIESNRAWWEASVTGADEAFAWRKKAENALVELHSDSAVFARLKALHDAGRVKDGILGRELDVMYRTFVPGQADPALQKRIVELQADVEQMFNLHRSEVDGKELTENEVRKILSESKDSALAEKAWKGYMGVGAKVGETLGELVRLRNRLARELGFENYYVMRLKLQEIEPDELFELFDELDELTRGSFARLKAEIDGARSAHFGIEAGELRPWHFGDLFFQEAPPSGEVNLDDLVREKDLVALARTYYAGLGTPIDDILGRSDLYEKKGKSPHAFCTNIDRRQDVRVLCNLKPNMNWMDTLFHELGHAIYDKYIGPDVPFLLREPAHSLITEGFAQMMGALVKNEEWLTKGLKVSPGRAAVLIPEVRRALRAEKLIFSRWTQVMVRFEHGMYGNPDQDLGKLWWDLKKRYQLLSPPESVSRRDYAAKIHVVIVPAYYHSYMMGDLFGCQLHAYIAREVMGVKDAKTTCFFGREDVGAFMKEKVFGPGNLYGWDELTERATGERLTARYFAEQYVQ